MTTDPRRISEGKLLVISVATAAALALSIVLAVLLSEGSDTKSPSGQAAPPSSPAGGPLTIATWNICSGIRTWCPSGGKPEILAEAISEVVVAERVDVVFLQEVCTAVVSELRDILGAEWAVHFRKTQGRLVVDGQELNGPEPCSDALGDNGIAIGHRLALARSDSASVEDARVTISSHPLPSPHPSGAKPAHQRLAMCVQLEAVALQLCNAHLPTREEDPTGELRAAGAAQLAQEVWFGERLGFLTVYGGDLNTRPDELVGNQRILDQLYERGAECDPVENPQATFKGAKIDYIFAGLGSSGIACSVVFSARSDHEILVARFQLPVAVEAVDRDSPPLLAQAYARADLDRPNSRLLVSALERGFNSVEVDVQAPTPEGDFPLDTTQGPDPWGRTLDEYYLRPLGRLVGAQLGKIHPDSRAPFTLVVDIRDSQPTAEMYEALERELRPYRGMLSRVEDGEIVPGAVRVVVPNNAALHAYLSRRSSSMFFVAVRAPWRVGYDEVPSSVFIAMANVRLDEVVESTRDLRNIEAEVRLAHHLGYRIRFYGYEDLGDTRESRRIWVALKAAEADFISTDDLAGLARVLSED